MMMRFKTSENVCFALDQLQANLEILKKKQAARLAKVKSPRLRRSYSYEFFLKRLNKFFIEAM